MKIIPMRDLKNTIEVEKHCIKEQGPVYVTKNGYGRLVVMDIEYYERVLWENHAKDVWSKSYYRGAKGSRRG